MQEHNSVQNRNGWNTKVLFKGGEHYLRVFTIRADAKHPHNGVPHPKPSSARKLEHCRSQQIILTASTSLDVDLGNPKIFFGCDYFYCICSAISWKYFSFFYAHPSHRIVRLASFLLRFNKQCACTLLGPGTRKSTAMMCSCLTT
uniref:Ovule protein n=1 Tax=Steinernema glaseri TaxID=37863 RepID=A0A1I8A7D6_9BILA